MINGSLGQPALLLHQNLVKLSYLTRIFVLKLFIAILGIAVLEYWLFLEYRPLFQMLRDIARVCFLHGLKLIYRPRMACLSSYMIFLLLCRAVSCLAFQL